MVLIDTIDHAATTGGYKIYLYFIKKKTVDIATYNQYIVSNGVTGKGFNLPQYITVNPNSMADHMHWNIDHGTAEEADNRDCRFAVKAIFDSTT
jgi:hypothetical protein